MNRWPRILNAQRTPLLWCLISQHLAFRANIGGALANEHTNNDGAAAWTQRAAVARDFQLVLILTGFFTKAIIVTHACSKACPLVTDGAPQDASDGFIQTQ